MTGAESVIIEHNLTSYLIASIGFLVSVLSVVVGYIIKLSMTKINNQIVSCKNDIMSEIKLVNLYAKETRKISDDNADDMQHHINSHHTKR